MVFLFNFQCNLRNIDWTHCCLENLDVNELTKNCSTSLKEKCNIVEAAFFFTCEILVGH